MNVGNQKNHKIKDKQMVLKKLSQFCMIAILCMATLFNFGVNPPSVFASESLLPFLENEECKFVMNDAVGVYGDNEGEIEVTYTLR